MSQQSLHITSRRIIIVQVGLGVLSSLAVYVATLSWLAVVSAAFGGLIAVIATAMSANRMFRASRMAYQKPALGVANLYMGATLRFLFVILAFALALGAFKLSAIPMILTFAIAQLGFLVPLFQKA